MGSAEEAVFYSFVLHEFCHYKACKIVRVTVTDVEVDIKHKKAFLTYEGSSFLKDIFIALFPCFFELFFGLYYFRGFFRVLWLKMWLNSRWRAFPRLVLSEMEVKYCG